MTDTNDRPFALDPFDLPSDDPETLLKNDVPCVIEFSYQSHEPVIEFRAISFEDISGLTIPQIKSLIHHFEERGLELKIHKSLEKSTEGGNEVPN